MEKWNTYADMLRSVVKADENPHALNFYEDDQWHSISRQQALQEIREVALGLVNLGVKRGDCVGIMALPSPHWTIANFAIAMAGGITVPIFPNIAEDNFIFEVKQTGVKIFFVDRTKPIPTFDKHEDLFIHVIELEDLGSDPRAIKYSDLLEQGRALHAERPHFYTELTHSQRPDDLAAIIYTSATTGQPKGVELTHYNMVHHLQEHSFPLDSKTRYLSILPLAHILGLSVNNIVFSGLGSIYYFNDPKNIGVICRDLHPTMMVVVPRLIERVYAKMLSAVQSAGYLKRHLGQWAFDLANQEEDSLIKHIVHPIVDKIVYSHLRDALGGKIEALISGGAPLNPHLNHFFQDIGVPIYEGWGLTEACPVTVNSHTNNKIGTVGQPFSSFELKISPEGEVLVRGSGVMRGYHKNPEATAAALDSEGWLHTGDKGELDEDGFLTLHGRFKEMYKTSTGEWVSPVPIEQEICKAPLIELALVIAEGRKFASCLLFPNREILDGLKETHGASHLTDEDFLNSDFVKGEMNRLFEHLNKNLNQWEQVHAYRFIPHPPSIEEGEITPSLKLRRDVVTKKYQHLIDAMYPEAAKV
jgi:long-chain acyl-CoA synthetase